MGGMAGSARGACAPALSGIAALSRFPDPIHLMGPVSQPISLPIAYRLARFSLTQALFWGSKIVSHYSRRLTAMYRTFVHEFCVRRCAQREQDAAQRHANGVRNLMSDAARSARGLQNPRLRAKHRHGPQHEKQHRAGHAIPSLTARFHSICHALPPHTSPRTDSSASVGATRAGRVLPSPSKLVRSEIMYRGRALASR